MDVALRMSGGALALYAAVGFVRFFATGQPGRHAVNGAALVLAWSFGSGVWLLLGLLVDDLDFVTRFVAAGLGAFAGTVVASHRLDRRWSSGSPGGKVESQLRTSRKT